MKRKKEVRFRHKVVVVVAKSILRPIVKLKYRYSKEKYKALKNEGPIIVLGNHTIPFDPILMGLSFSFHLYYFASEQIFNLGFLSKLLVFAVNPIRKAKAVSDMSAIRKARQIVSEGGSIGIYPEGNVTYDGSGVNINQSIVKLIRLLKLPIVFFITEGLYFSNPRWSANRKKGLSKGEIKEILRPETYDTMSDEDLFDYIKARISVNAYEQNTKNHLYKGKDLALGLERLLFMDLKTKKPFVTYSKGDYLKSTDSDFELKYLNTGYLKDKDNKTYNLVDLNQQTIQAYLNYYKSDNVINFKEVVNLEKTTKETKINLKSNEIVLYKHGMDFILKNGTQHIPFEDVISISIQGKRKIILYTAFDTWLITMGDYSSPYKYLLTYQFYKEGENIYDSNIRVSKFGL